MSRDMMWKAPRPAHGMTLFELMLAVTFFSMVSAAAMNLVRLSYQSQQLWGVSLEPSLEMERALERLERDVEAAQRFFDIPFDGAADRLELARVASVPAHDDEPEPEWVRVVYRLQPAGQSMELIREEFRWRPAEARAEPLRRETLLHLATGTFAFGQRSGDEPLAWMPQWHDAKGRAPRLIKFDLALPVGGPQPFVISRVFRNPAGITAPEEVP